MLISHVTPNMALQRTRGLSAAQVLWSAGCRSAVQALPGGRSPLNAVALDDTTCTVIVGFLALWMISCASTPQLAEGDCANHEIPGEEVDPPSAAKQVEPDYPDHLVKAGIKGLVVLNGCIAANGRVVNIRVVSSPHPDLAAAAIEALGKYRYRPARYRGRPIPVNLTHRMNFELTEARQ